MLSMTLHSVRECGEQSAPAIQRERLWVLCMALLFGNGEYYFYTTSPAADNVHTAG